MTQILSLLTHDYVLQVSDRLVTRATPGSVERAAPFDSDANKSVVYRAKDAIVAIGYSGSAYMSGRPTDQWLAEQLFGDGIRSRMPGHGPPLVIRPGLGHRALDIGQSLALIKAEAAQLLRRRRDSRLQISVAGWMWRSRDWLWRPIAYDLTWNPALDGFRETSTPRHWQWPTLVRVADRPPTKQWPIRLAHIPDGMLSDDAADALGERLALAWKSPTQCAAALIAAIRTTAKVQSTVGADCMSVFLPRAQPRVEIEFVPVEQRVGCFGTARVRSTIPVSFSPWLIAAQMAAPPAMVIGDGFGANLGGIQVTVHGAPVGPDSGIRAGFFSQERPPQPRS